MSLFYNFVFTPSSTVELSEHCRTFLLDFELEGLARICSHGFRKLRVDAEHGVQTQDGQPSDHFVSFSCPKYANCVSPVN